MRAAVRMAALMSLKEFFVWTHDSIGVGEDGPTHEPVEQLSSLRAMPNLFVFRPASGVENTLCWQKALGLNAPSAFVLSRQGLEATPEAAFGSVENGAYLLKEGKNAQITLLASGSEVELCLKASDLLAKEGVVANVVSAPCFELFESQDKSYKSRILTGKVLAVEAASAVEWYKYADDVLGMSTFGESGKAEKLFEHFGFSPENIAKKAKELLDK